MSKNYLIIGASSGIGHAIAEKLLAAGNQVFSASRNQPDLNITHLTWDAMSPDNTVFANLPEEIHGIAYCPGTINLKPFHRLTQEDFKQDFQIHVLGAVSVLQTLLPKLKKAEGGASIVLFSTVAAKVGMGFHASVAASKGAIEGLTISLAAEWSANKIRVNCVAPSLTDTPLAKNLLSSDEKKEASNKRHPIGRFGTSEDVASMAAFLMKDESSWITGQIFGVDGGMSTLKTM
jgi:3-oxoacyl-[acyl-carrier protein] reductase